MRRFLIGAAIAACLATGAAAEGYNAKLAGWIKSAETDPKFAAMVLEWHRELPGSWPLAVILAASATAEDIAAYDEYIALSMGHEDEDMGDDN